MDTTKLEEMLSEMRALDSKIAQYDAEASHSFADGILTDALEIFGKETGTERLVAEIVEAWERVEKWYA